MALTLRGSTTRTTSSDTTTLTLTATPVAGKKLLLAAMHSNSGATTATDSRGNTWAAASSVVTSQSPIMNLQTFTCTPTVALASGDTITLAHSQAAGSASALLVEPSVYMGGLDDSGVSVVSAGTSSTPHATVTTAGANTEAVAFAVWSASDTSITQPSGFTGTSGTPIQAGARNLAVADGVLAVSGAFTYTANLPAAAPHATVLLAFTVTGAAVQPAGAGAGGGTLRHAWTGIPTATAAPIKTRTTSATAVRVKYSVNADLSSASFTSIVAPDADGYALHTLTGLTAGTVYYYDTEVGGSLAGKLGRLRTDPGAGSSFKMVFGSCLESGSGTSTKAFDSAVAQKPDLFIHLGDFHYDDNTSTSAASHRQSLETQIGNNTGLATLIRQAPTAYAMSDHDSGSNNWSGGPESWTPAVNAAYKQVVPNAPVLTDNTGNYWSFSYGGVRFIVTDSRSLKSSDSASDSSSHTMYGATQLAWIKTQLQASEPYKVLCMDTPWIASTSMTNSGDNWGGFATERANLGGFIKTNGINAVIIHGDSHSLIADDGSHSVGNVPVFGAAPFDKTASIKGGPAWTAGPWPASGYTTASNGEKSSGPQSQQYGLVTFTPGANTMTMAFNGIGSDGATRVSLSKAFTSVVTGGGGTGGSTPTPTPIPGHLTVAYRGADMSASGTDSQVTASVIAATGGATVGISTAAYATAPVIQLQDTPSTSAAQAVANGDGFGFTIARTTGPWSPTALRFNVAKGGATDTRGVAVRTSADGFASNLFTNTTVTSVRTTFESRTMDLSSIGTITGPLTFRFYCFTGTTNSQETLEFDDIEVDLTYTSTGAALAPDSWDGTTGAAWSTVDTAGGATFSLTQNAGAASIALPATPAHRMSTRTSASVAQAASGDFDVSIKALSPIAGMSSGDLRGVGLAGWDASRLAFVSLQVHCTSTGAVAVQMASGDATTTTAPTTFTTLTVTPPSPLWLRLKRTGSTWTGYTSPDGVAWTQIASQVVTFAQAAVGFYAVSSGTAYTAQFGPFALGGTSLPTGVNAAWSLWNGASETPLFLDGLWTGQRVQPLSFGGLNTTAPAGPTVTSVAVGQITDTSATVVVATDRPALVSVDYGPGESGFTSRVVTAGLGTSATLTLPSLTPGTGYAGQVTAVAPDGQSATKAMPAFVTTGGSSGGGTTGGGGGNAVQIVTGPTKAVTDTTASITFTTDVPAARRLQYRVVGTTAWTTNERSAAPGTQHTVNLSGLVAATQYEAQILLATTTAGLDAATPYSLTWATSIPTGGGTGTGGTGTGTGGGGTGGGGSTSAGALKWSPPTTTVDVHIPSGGGRVTLPAGKVARLVWPSSPILLPGGGTGSGPAVEVNGGGASLGFHSVGGTVGWQNWRTFSGDASQDSNGAMEINDFADNAQIYLEGFATTQKITEGIDFDMKAHKNITITLANCLLGTSDGGATGSRGIQHADCLQIYGGGKNLRLDGVTMWSHYQNLFYTPSQHVGTSNRDSQYSLQLRNVQFNAMSNSAYIAYIITGCTNSVSPTTVTNSWYSESTSEALSKRFKGWASKTDMPGIWKDIVAAGSLKSGFNSAIARVPGNTGVNYTSPGYQ